MSSIDHMYTNTIYNTNTYDPAEYTYKLSENETHDLVKLRVSNQCLFTGRRNSSKYAWRAILKHMGLQWKMTPNQAMKKWENLKKKYKELKYPPEGVRVYPDQWRYFQLVNDAVEGRLAGSAPLLIAIRPGDDGGKDFLPDARPKKKRPSVRQVGKMEIEVRVNGEEEEEEDEEEEEEEEGEEEGSKGVMDCDLEEMENERAMMEGERAALESEREVLEQERMALERERGELDREMAYMDRDRASLEREKAAMEREKALMERERALIEKDRAAVSRDRCALERERAVLERDKVVLEQQKTGMGNGTEGTEGEDRRRTVSESLERRERFLNLFEKLIDTL